MEVLKSEYQAPIVFHPGESLGERLEELKMGSKEFAVRSGKPEKTIAAILKGRSSITPEMAVQFENVLNIPAHFWLNKQRSYDEFMAREKRKEILEEAQDWAKSFPYPDMAKKGWVPAMRKATEKAEALFSFFGISKHTSWEKYYLKKYLKVAFRISLAPTKEPHAISAWLRKGELQATELEAPAFDKKLFKENLVKIKNLMARQPGNFLNELQKLCLKSGVKVVFTPNIKKAPINGSTRWINNTPVIQLSGRYKRNDIFWFTFYHEAGHILKHGKKNVFLEDIKYKKDMVFSDKIQRQEDEADEFAVQWTLNKEQEEEIRRQAKLTEKDIEGYAKKFETHPAIIIGRLQHKKLISFNRGRRFFEPVQFN